MTTPQVIIKTMFPYKVESSNNDLKCDLCDAQVGMIWYMNKKNYCQKCFESIYQPIEQPLENFGGMTGWTCPGCGMNYSPFVTQCDCRKYSIFINGNTSGVNK